MYTSQIDALKKYLNVKYDERKMKHNINNIARLLPFGTRNPERTEFENGYEAVIGDIVRRISNVKLASNYETEEVLEEILKVVNVEDQDLSYFKQIFRGFISKDAGQIKVFHPHVYHFMKYTQGSKAKGEQEIGQFMKDIFFDDVSFVDFFAKKDIVNVLEKLLIEHMGELANEPHKQKYDNLFQFTKPMFELDVQFLMKNKEYFIKHFALLTAFYYFTYVCQMTEKLERGIKADMTSYTAIYYLLDWEAGARSRKSYTDGYKNINEAEKNLLCHMNVLDQLNILMASDRTMLYGDLREQFFCMPQLERDAFINDLKRWIKEYRYIIRKEEDLVLEDDYDSLVRKLRESIQLGLDPATVSRYPKYILNIGKKYFLKTHGSSGYMLNCTQELLLLLIGVTVKDERKSLKAVFEGLERRGMFLDRYSKEEVIRLLDKLNLIDKKSDSGDAQYVKPIL